MDTNSELKNTKNAMDAAIKHAVEEFNSLHTGKASTSMVENLQAEVYGGYSKLRDIAAITTPDAKTIQLQPWDKATIKPIEKAIIAANLGITPLINGNIIRCPLPEMSRERRQELCKVANNMAEAGRVKVRGIRRDAMEIFKKAKKDSAISEDDLKKLEKEVQSFTDNAIAEIDKALATRVEEIMKV